MSVLCRFGIHHWKFRNSRKTGYLRRDEYVCVRCGATKAAR